MRMTMLALPLLLLAGCAGGEQGPPKLTEKQTLKLERELEGKTPGDKVSCVYRRGSNSLTAISDEVLIYRDSSRLVYKNELIGRCSGLTSGDTLVIRTYGSQYCKGDIGYVVDLNSGIQRGSCALGDFTPYRSPKK